MTASPCVINSAMSCRACSAASPADCPYLYLLAEEADASASERDGDLSLAADHGQGEIGQPEVVAASVLT